MFRQLSLAAVLVLAVACLSSTMRVDQTLSTSFGDLTAIKTIEVTTHSGAVLMRGDFSDAPETSGKVERTASLASPTNGVSKGTAVIEIARTNGLSEEEIKVELEDLPYPESCRLMADGRELTIFSAPQRGKLEFRFTRRVTMANGRTN